MLVLLARGAMGGSANIKPVSRAPPKQRSMELNQQARGLERDTWRTSEQGQDTHTACSIPVKSLTPSQTHTHTQIDEQENVITQQSKTC